MIVDSRSLAFPISDSSQVGETRRAVSRLAESTGLDATAAGKLAIIATELANNLHKHARDGIMLLRAFTDQSVGVELMAVDKGPGIADVQKCFRDGFSTSGTPGTGLGALARMSDAWDVYSLPGLGTVFMAQVRGKISPGKSRFQSGSVCLPIKGETRCGDTWAHVAHSQFERVMVADGLGHGPHAAEAAEEAVAIFQSARSSSLPDLMQALHNALRKTRGAAIALAELDPQRRLIRYVGVGNISATILHAGTTRSLVSQNGTVGHEARRIQEFQYPWPEGATLVMNSDGLLSKWELSKYPGLIHRHPSLLAAVLWRDFTRGRDDATVLAIRELS